MRQGPLRGVRVLALENVIAGPYGSMIMGDLGAEVIKIEQPQGDIARQLFGPRHKGESFYYLAFNRNKKSVMLDLRVGSNKKVFYDLVRLSDVVWDNFRPGVMERLKINYENLRKINPRIVCCSITGYGTSGPRREQPSFDLIAQAISGIMSITGEPGRPPVRCGAPIGDLAAGMMGVIGVLAALLEKEVTARGQKVEVSLLDSSISSLAYDFSRYFCSGEIPGPIGAGHVSFLPYDAFKTRDGRYIVVGKIADEDWPQLARIIEAEWMLKYPRFQTPEGRAEHKEELKAILQECFLKADARHWVNLFEAKCIPGGLVQNLAEVANDPEVLHNKMILSLKHPLGGEVKLTGNPVKMEGIKEDEYDAPPLLGQHTEEVLKEILGYSEEQIRRVKEGR